MTVSIFEPHGPPVSEAATQGRKILTEGLSIQLTSTCIWHAAAPVLEELKKPSHVSTLLFQVAVGLQAFLALTPYQLYVLLLGCWHEGPVALEWLLPQHLVQRWDQPEVWEQVEPQPFPAPERQWH